MSDIAPKWKTGSRECGGCTLCCKVVEVELLGKPANVWCQHCKPGQGCGIYSDRPEVCRDWYCEWVRSEELGEEWYPAKSKMVVHLSGNEDGGELLMMISVDPAYPGRWREEPWHSQIRRLALIGLRGEFGRRFAVRVRVGERRWQVLPNKEVEVSKGGGNVVFPIGDGEYHCVAFKTKEQATEFARGMNAVREAVAQLPEAERMKMLLEVQARRMGA
jgi:hypothetical protein